MRLGDRFKTELRVQLMSIASSEQERAQGLQIGVSKDRSHHRLRNPTASELGQNEHVCQVREYGAVGDNASECDLSACGVHAETQGVADRALDGFAAATFGPVRSAKELVNHRDIEAGLVGRDLKFGCEHG
jgi:hypothetical protein